LGRGVEILMEFFRVKELWPVLPELPVKEKRQLVPKAMHSVAQRPVAENRPARAKRKGQRFAVPA
jgi:hypothetical protein